MMNLDWRHAGSGAAAEAPAAGFPQRGDIFDQAAVLARFREAGVEPDAASCRVLNVWHIPGRSLRVIYRLADRAGDERIYSVEFCRRGEAADAGEGGILLANWAARALRFPADPALPGLSQLVDGRALAARLAPLFDQPPPGEAMTWSLLSWLPGERAAVRQDWPGQSLVAKLHADAAASHKAMLSLWHAGGRRFGMPEPLLAARELPARWERLVPGERIETRLGSEPLPALLEQVMSGLAELHRSTLPGLPRQGAAEVLARIERKVLARIGRALPSLAPAAAAFAARLAAAAPTARPLRVIHGDLHTANLLLADAGVVFIDLDSLAYGDPAFDLALLGTRLVLWAMNEDERAAEIAAAVAALPELYAKAGGDEIRASTYAWYVAALLVGRQIKTCIRHLAPGLPALAPRLLGVARTILETGRVEAAALSADRNSGAQLMSRMLV